MSIVLDGKAIADKLTQSVADEINSIKKANARFAPGLAAVLVGEDPASKVYVRNKKKSAIGIGMEALDYYLPESTTQKELEEYVSKLSEDVSVDGILVQLPLPTHIDQEKIIDAISPDKDVDGLHPYNVGLLVKGQPRFVPATPAGVQHILVESEIEVSGKHVVICGRSEIVGKPLGLLLMQRNKGATATVTVCHSRTANLQNITADTISWGFEGTSTTGTPFGGLTNLEEYYIIRLNDNAFRVATTKYNSSVGRADDLTSQGTGTDHKFSIINTLDDALVEPDDNFGFNETWTDL